MLWKITKSSMSVFIILSLLACASPECSPNFFEDVDCRQTEDLPIEDISGIWTIKGEGSRWDCREDFLNTDRFTIRSLDIPIDHDAETGRLTLGDSNFAENFFIENGDVSGRCVTFDSIESTRDAEIRYEWNGAIENGEIRGKFTSLGPKTCQGKGEFTIDYQ